MKVIFLDIDGVMNSTLYAHKQYSQRWLRLKTYKWWLKGVIRFIFNGFKKRAYSLRDIKYPKNFYTFEYRFKRLKEQTDPQAWKFLINLIEETDARICISSVWKRHFNDTSEWNKALVKLGFKDGVFVGITGERRTLRGSEIKEWLDSTPNVEKYAIIDDDNDILLGQRPFFFQTDGYCGLSPNICYRIKNYFNGTL